jgi:LPS export ABC transporter protein LptC/lipopolysaccharide transport protein LptA
MTIRRYVLIGVPVLCVLTIIVSLIISHPKKASDEKKENSSREKASATQKQMSAVSGTNTVTQMVQGLTFPNYDEKGREVVVMRGESTLLLSNDVYKIVSPEIEVVDAPDANGGTQSFLITSDSGEMNNASREGYLSENVVVHLDPETLLNTNYLKYLPEKKIVYTDDQVAIHGKGIKIVGQGCEIDLTDKKMCIKKDAEMEMDGVKNDLFFLSTGGALQENQASVEEVMYSEEKTATGKSGEKTFIRSSGQLTFDRSAEANIMTFYDNVEVKKGSSTVYSDKLVVYLDPDTRKTTQAIASGNVLASQGTKIAKGGCLTWDVNTQSAILEDTMKAEFVQEDLNIDALKMIFYKNTSKIDIPSSGSLKAKFKEKARRKKSPAETDEAAPDVNVKWGGKMNFHDDTREAVFEKNIEIIKEDSILYCDNLNVVFNERDFNLKSLQAKNKIHIVDKRGGLYSEAVGDQVAWDAKNKVTVLKGQPFALLREGNTRQILSPKVSFFEDENNILCEGSGSLYEKGKEPSDENSVGDTDIKVNWSKKMLYHSTQKKVSFSGEVQVARGGQKLNGDQMDAYLDNKRNISKIIAEGNVYFYCKILNGSEGFGSFFTWDFIQNVAVLTGNPKAELRKEGSRTYSQKVYFNMAENQITWEGRPHWQLISSE